MITSVLHLAPYAVFPATYGGALRTHNICNELSGHFKVDLFCQQVGRRDMAWKLSPLIRTLSSTYSEYCSRDPVSLLTYAAAARIGCPVFFQSWVLSLAAPSWLKTRLLGASVINVEHPWQFKWVHDRIGGSKPIVLTAHNIEAELSEGRTLRAPGPMAALLRRQALRHESFAMRHATRIFTMSAENSDFIVRTYGIAPERCVVIPNGVDCRVFTPVSPSRRKERQQQLGLAGKFVVLFAGSAHAPNKAAVEQILRWAQGWPDDRMQFLVAGSIGSAFSHVRHARVMFTGPVDDILPYFEAADVAVNPLASGSGTTLKQVEFMAMGLPTIATPSGARGVPLKDGEHAYIRSADEIPMQLRWLIGQPSQVRDAIGRNARGFVEQYFDWSVIAAKVVDVYRELESSFAANAVRSSASAGRRSEAVWTQRL